VAPEHREVPDRGREDRREEAGAVDRDLLGGPAGEGLTLGGRDGEQVEHVDAGKEAC
jgi:hypothetical protein